MVFVFLCVCLKRRKLVIQITRDKCCSIFLFHCMKLEGNASYRYRHAYVALSWGMYHFFYLKNTQVVFSSSSCSFFSKMNINRRCFDEVCLIFFQ